MKTPMERGPQNRGWCSGSQAWTEDLRRLAGLQQKNSSIATRLALVTASALPVTWQTDSGRAIRREQTLDGGPSFQIRRIFRALPLLPRVDAEQGRPSLNRGPCVVLLEPSFSPNSGSR